MSTVAKALSLLNTLADMPREPGLSEIAAATGLDKATARRMLVELEKFGFIEQDEHTKRYRLGNAPVRLANIREGRYPFLEVAIPHLRTLAEATNETVHLSQFMGGQLATTHVELSGHANRINIESGSILPFHATASGIAFLSAWPPARRAELIDTVPKSFTRRTVTDLSDVLRIVSQAQARGYSIGEGGYEQGVTSVAAPILDPQGRPVGTVALAAPATRMPDNNIRHYGSLVAETADRIARSKWGLGKQAI